MINKIFRKVGVLNALLGTGIALLLPQVLSNQTNTGATTADTLVAPNLMIIMANGFSMTREMDDATYPSVPASEIVYFENEKAPGTALPIPFYQWKTGDQPTSKLYLAKQAMTSILTDSSVSANVNFGFATWRTVFAQPTYVGQGSGHGAGHYVYPADPNIYNAPTPARYAYAADPLNFKAMAAWTLEPMEPNNACPRRGSMTDTNTRAKWDDAIIGRNLCDGDKGVIKDSSAGYMNANGGVGGLPRHVAPNHLGGYWDIRSNPQGVGYAQNNYPAPNNYEWVSPAHYHRSDLPINVEHFCDVSYNSDQNEFAASYVFDYAFPYGQWYGVYDFRYTPFDASGTIAYPAYTQTCSGTTVNVVEKEERIGSRLMLGGGVTVPAYGAAIMGFYSWSAATNESFPHGVLSGWSGENILIDGGGAGETLTASYPSGPANPENPAVPGRALISKGLVKENIRHMGPFLDLPDPTVGYVDQRPVLQDFMLPVQMARSGLDYDPVTQKIAPDASGKSTKGIAASDSQTDGQSAVYDSLFGALAYYSAYKKVDPFDACRSNHVLLLYDGRENSRYYWDASVPGGVRFADPAEMAQRLKTEFNVSTHVIIISSIAGDIDEANRIAKAGGTTVAYAIGDYVQLQTALRGIISNLQQKIQSAPLALSVATQAGSFAYIPYNRIAPAYGTIEAHIVKATGEIDVTETWNADSRMTPALRSALLQSSVAGALTPLQSVPDAEFQIPATSTLTANTVRAYAIDPSFNTGAYLAGRKLGSYIGRITNSAPQVIDPIASPELSVDTDYRTYTKALPADARIVLFSSNDGFLYAIGQEGGVNPGVMRWGWMPGHFLKDLKDYSVFHGTKRMDGDFRALDVKSGANFRRVVLGVADGGRLHYALELKGNGDLNRVLWEDAHLATASEVRTAPQTFIDSGTSYATYLVGTTLRTRQIVSGTSSDRDLSTLSVSGKITALHLRGAMAFIGTAEGEVFTIDLSVAASTPRSIGKMTTSGTGTAVELSISAMTSAVWQGAVHLTAQSQSRVTVFKRALDASPADSWTRVWSTFAGGSEPSAAVTALPAQARISAPLSIVEGIIIAPVAIDGNSTATSCVSSDARVFFFGLGDGAFPTNQIISPVDGSVFTRDLSIGLGDALRTRLTQLPGGLIGGYASSQLGAGSAGGGGGASSLFTVRMPTARLIWWKEVDRAKY